MEYWLLFVVGVFFIYICITQDKHYVIEVTKMLRIFRIFFSLTEYHRRNKKKESTVQVTANSYCMICKPVDWVTPSD